jgi:N-methylhydantoinase B
MQVMWNRLISVVEEQALTLLRTSFSTSVREAGDLSAGVFDPAGWMLAQAIAGTPGHVNTMAEAVVHFLAEIPRERMYLGDTYVTNDPWKGTGHLHDITTVSPSFLGDTLVGFFACTAHVVDVGGRGFGADGKSVYEEGIQIPIMKFAERGQVNEDRPREPSCEGPQRWRGRGAGRGGARRRDQAQAEGLAARARGPAARAASPSA